MLERIAIKNYAVIDNLEIDFHQGFSVFTGETGAGKSVLIGALGLLLGARSDSSMIRFGTESMIIEGEFSINNFDTLHFLTQHNISDPHTLIIRREIHKTSKSRIFINSNQETLNKLEEIGNHLADMHGQHDHQLLLNKKVHGDILDAFSGLNELQEEFAHYYYQTLNKLEEKKLLEENADSLRKEKEYYENAYQEITTSNLNNNEDQELDYSLIRIQNSEKIFDALHKAYQGIYESEINATLILEDAQKSLHSIATFSQKYEELSDMLADALAKTRESGHLLSSYLEESDFDTDDLDTVLDRIALIKELKRKYQKDSIDQLNQFAEECSSLLSKVDNLDQEMKHLNEECIFMIQKLGEKAIHLSQMRQRAALSMSSKIEKELAFLGMEASKFEVKITYIKQEDSFLILNNNPLAVSPKGIDKIEFLISTNLGEIPKPLVKIASGGEISRIMLSIKSVLAQSDPVGTGVFDEIDSGIGGMIAHNVALKMQEISKLRQILCITHLAQIAAKADYHYKVLKQIDNNRTFTTVIELSSQERITEIARMLGGEGENSETLAREMLQK